MSGKNRSNEKPEQLTENTDKSMNQTQINCPKCGNPIDVQDILAHQLEEQIKQKYNNDLAEKVSQLEEKSMSLNKAKQEFEEKKRKDSEAFQEQLEEQLKRERGQIETKLKAKLLAEKSEEFDALQKELNEKSVQLKELSRTKAEIEKLKREKEELRESVELETQQKLNEMLIAEKTKIRKVEEERNELKFRELQKQLDDQKKLTEEMKRKQEQGSMQLQGEVQELAIEEWLTAEFPLDSIEEIKKGARGGDCIQVVNTRTQQNCGKIYYESKRTKDFKADWITKLKADMREKSADIGVIVSEARPVGFDRMGILEGIWICNFEEFKGLCAALRDSIIKISLAVVSQENKGEKMYMLYDFLTSNTFKMQVEAIVEGFTSLKTALEAEKIAMQKIWKEREKQIDKVVINTVGMYGSIRGIAGNAIQQVPALELPFSNDKPEEDAEKLTTGIPK